MPVLGLQPAQVGESCTFGVVSDDTIATGYPGEDLLASYNRLVRLADGEIPAYV